MLKKISCFIFLFIPIFSRDILLELKGAYFLPTSSRVRKIYGNGAGLYGAEATFQFCENKNWYGFASLDFLNKKGHSIGLNNKTKMNFVAAGFGLKYLINFCAGDFYIGLGLQPFYLSTINCSEFVMQTTSELNIGGIAKIGTYFNLPRNIFLDLFMDYSFANSRCNKCLESVIPLKTNLSAAIFGVGIGYRF